MPGIGVRVWALKELTHIVLVACVALGRPLRYVSVCRGALVSQGLREVQSVGTGPRQLRVRQATQQPDLSADRSSVRECRHMTSGPSRKRRSEVISNSSRLTLTTVLGRFVIGRARVHSVPCIP